MRKRKQKFGMFRCPLFLALIFLPLFYHCSGEEPAPPPEEMEVSQKKLIIGLLPEQNVFTQKERYRPLGDYLSEKLDCEVVFKLLESYGTIMKEIKEETVDGAFFGSLNFTLTHRQAGVEPLARPLWNNGESTYAGYIFTRKDSGLTADVSTWRGKSFAFVHTATTAGYVFPLAYLYGNGVTDLEPYFSKVFFSGSHDASALAVFNGEADIGAGKNHMYNRLAEQDPVFRENMVILSESKKVPSNGLAVRPGLNPRLKSGLKEVLLKMHEVPEGREALAKFQAQKFIDTTVEDYAPVFEMAREARLDLDNYPLSQEYTPFSSAQPISEEF